MIIIIWEGNMDRHAGEYIGKTVLTLAGERMGEIKNLTFDKNYKRLKNLVIFDDEQEEYHVSLRSVFCHGENVVLVKINLYPPAENTYLSPLNVKCYDIKGKFLGLVTDLKFDEDEKTVTTLVLENKEELSQNNIVSHGKDAVLFDFSEKPKKIVRRKLPPKKIIDEMFLKIEPLTEDIIAKDSAVISEGETTETGTTTEAVTETGTTIEAVIETGTTTEAVTEALERDELKTEIPKKPDNLVVGARLLTGRKVKKDIYLGNGKLLISEGTIITLPIVNLALNNGKLFELTVNSLGNLPN